MRLDEYLAYDAVGLAALVRAGQVTAIELADLARQRHEATHATINAVVEWYDQPTVQSRGDRHGVDSAGSSRAVGSSGSDEAVPGGTFAGVPFLRKDFGSGEAGRLMEMGSRLAAGYVATETSPYFERILGAGAQVVGRTAVPEFALHATTESTLSGATRNPLDTSTSSGGSSGGASAAIRAGVVPFAHASDAAGSIRIPAAVTGLIGLKTTRDLVPRSVDDWRGLVVEFVLARSIADVVASLRVLAPSPSHTAEVLGGAAPLRIGLSVEHWAGLADDPAVVAAVESTARRLEALGHHVEPAPRPFDYEQLMSTWFPLFGAGAVEGIERVARLTGRAMDALHLEPNTLEVIERSAGLTPADHTDAEANRATVTAEVAAAFQHYDLLLTPTLDRAVIPLGRMAGDAPMDAYLVDGDAWFDRLYLANVIGWPAISVPAHPNPGDTPVTPPIGAQFMAPPHREDALVRIAAELIGDAIIPCVEPSPLATPYRSVSGV
ncbi:MAG: amidase [Acidimicrobiales bacterium]